MAADDQRHEWQRAAPPFTYSRDVGGNMGTSGEMAPADEAAPASPYLQPVTGGVAPSSAQKYYAPPAAAEAAAQKTATAAPVQAPEAAAANPPTHRKTFYVSFVKSCDEAAVEGKLVYQPTIETLETILHDFQDGSTTKSGNVHKVSLRSMDYSQVVSSFPHPLNVRVAFADEGHTFEAETGRMIQVKVPANSHDQTGKRYELKAPDDRAFNTTRQRDPNMTEETMRSMVFDHPKDGFKMVKHACPVAALAIKVDADRANMSQDEHGVLMSEEAVERNMKLVLEARKASLVEYDFADFAVEVMPANGGTFKDVPALGVNAAATRGSTAWLSDPCTFSMAIHIEYV